jgi:uncharacterized protein (TIGR04255 family)
VLTAPETGLEPERVIPKKLKHDAIVEAVFEVRFDPPETGVPEIFLGRLADYSVWKTFPLRNQLPAAQLPAFVRQSNPNLRFQPVLEIASAAKDRLVRIGPEVLSYHRRIPYVGWEKFRPELMEAVDGLFDITHNLKIQRLGLRYMNALREDVHGFKTINDLAVELKVAGRPVLGRVNINFVVDVFAGTQCTVRIATTEFIQGDLPAETTVYVDVDVGTKDGFRTNDKIAVKHWIDDAHAMEKEQFFLLWPAAKIEALQEG